MKLFHGRQHAMQQPTADVLESHGVKVVFFAFYLIKQECMYSLYSQSPVIEYSNTMEVLSQNFIKIRAQLRE